MKIYPRRPYISDLLTPRGLGSISRLYKTVIKKYEEIKYECVGKSRTLRLKFVVEYLGNMIATIDLKHDLIIIGLPYYNMLILNGIAYRYPIFHTTNVKSNYQKDSWFITKRMLIKLGKVKVNYRRVIIMYEA